MNVISKGERNVEILKQGQNDPYTVEDQVAIIYAGSKNLLKEVPVNKVKEFEFAFLAKMDERHPEILTNFRSGKYDKADLAKVKELAKELTARFND